MIVKKGIVVLDFGGQYTQLIARRIREQEVFSAILPCNAKLDEIRRYDPAGIILSGGPSSVYDKDAPVCDLEVLRIGVPVLGVRHANLYGWRMRWAARCSRRRGASMDARSLSARATRNFSTAFPAA